MNKQEIYDQFTAAGIPFEVTEHEAVYTMEDLAQIPLAHPEAEAKNLFVRDDKKQHYYMITVPGEKRVDLKLFQKQQGLRKLSFGSADDLMALLNLIPGAVSPFGLLNDEEHRVELYLDRSFEGKLISIHPNDNTATVVISQEMFQRYLAAVGNSYEYIELY